MGVDDGTGTITTITDVQKARLEEFKERLPPILLDVGETKIWCTDLNVDSDAKDIVCLK